MITTILALFVLFGVWLLIVNRHEIAATARWAHRVRPTYSHARENARRRRQDDAGQLFFHNRS